MCSLGSASASDASCWIAPVKFTDFRRCAERTYEEIPEAYKQGIGGLIVSRDAVRHPEFSDVYTLGECLTASWPSEWQGPDTTRSSVVLYWGSFRDLAAGDSDFDWESEVWETLTHELRHHLESLAEEDQLEEVDYAADQSFKRQDGLEFDPWYYQHGDPVGPGTYRVEERVLLEQVWNSEAFYAVETVAFAWDGRSWTIPRPERLGDVHYVWVDGVVQPPMAFELVLVRRRGWWEQVVAIVTPGGPEVIESEAPATEIVD